MEVDARKTEAEPAVRIQHVALDLFAADLDRAKEFWQLCGFKEVEAPPSLRGRGIWVEAGPAGNRTQVHLLITGGEGSRRRRFGGHVAVVAPNFEAQIEALRSAGFAVEERTAHWGAARVFVEHPGGHTVELMAFAPSG